IAVNEELLRHLIAGREQQSRPEHTVEAKDVLSDQVPHLGPKLLTQVLAVTRIRERAQVIDQRIDPDVDDLIGVPGDRDAPGLAGTAEAEVLQATGDERAGL